MRLGVFTMPMHDPARDYTQVLEEDRQAIILADQLGYNEYWVGEHFSSLNEPVPSPLMLMASVIPETKNIVFGTGVINVNTATADIVDCDIAPGTGKTSGGVDVYKNAMIAC